MGDLDNLRERLAPLLRYGCVGFCVNSVTHDVNNFLGAILAYSELIEQDDAISDENRRMLANIQDSVKRCTESLGALTMIARKPRSDKSVIELGVFVDQVLNLKRYEFKMDRVALEFSAEKNIPNLLVDRPRLALALLYVLTNAYEAVVGTQGAKISVEARNGAGVAEIVVKDSGPGVAEPDPTRIFDPFYTSKGGDHLGLGLTLAKDYVSEFGNVTWEPDRGFVIRIKTHN